MTIHHGDCLDVMAAMEPESVDAIVTDPPYGLEFMGKEWDKLGLWGDVGKGKSAHALATGRPSGRRGFDGYGVTPSYQAGVPAQKFHFAWAEAAYRVAKPSAYLLAFGGTRTVHRMTVALEDAGWIIRDMLVWGYASGFPKSKASLKPAWEPIVMARKPGPLRMLAIDECRIGYASDADYRANSGFDRTSTASMFAGTGPSPAVTPAGRWPANIVLTDPIFDGGIEGVVGGGESRDWGVPPTFTYQTPDTMNERKYGMGRGIPKTEERQGYGDSGTYSRFFLIPKADRADREPVLGGLSGLDPAEARTLPSGYAKERGDGWNPPLLRRNQHPTVKPTDLMRHLVRLVTPTGGTVLDPFLGSGSTALAAEMEGFAWIGIEREAEYVAIAEARLNGTQRGLGI